MPPDDQDPCEQPVTQIFSPSRQLIIRTLSALLLVIPALAALYFGDPYFFLLILLAALCVIGEWVMLCRQQQFGWVGLTATLLVASVLLLFQQTGLLWALTVLVAGMLGALLVLGLRDGRWMLLGLAYAAVPTMAMYWLYQAAPTGPHLVGLLIAIVAATDIGAYFAGRMIGGPRLAPKISPGKTWAGLAGGILAAAIVGAFGWSLLLQQPVWYGAGIGIALALVAQAGDLFESAVKRYFGVKDSGSLIPGHGGVLDRFDGLITATLFLAMVQLLTEGKIATTL